jgi:hypothetical protein
MWAEFAAAEAHKRAGEDEEGGPAKRSKAEPLSDAVLEVLSEVREVLFDDTCLGFVGLAQQQGVRQLQFPAEACPCCCL